MSTKFPKYAQSEEEFIETAQFYIDRVGIARSRAHKITTSSQFCDYLCDNAHILFGSRMATILLEERLIELLDEESWTGARIYLQRLFPMSAALSGRRFLPKPL